MDPVLIGAFLSAGLLLNLTPGADVAFAVASGAQGGARAGVAAAAGITLGSLCHTCLAAFGLAAVLAAQPAAYDVIRWAGAVYLLWLAWRAWQSAQMQTGATDVKTAVSWSLRGAFLRGALTNLLNPKVALFQLAFLPQFADPMSGPIWQQMVLLGLLFALTGFFVTAAYGALAGRFAAALRQRGAALNRLCAIVFAGLAARLALS